MKKILLFLILIFSAINLSLAQEKAIKNLRQLTRGGDNAEAYFSPDGKFLTLQVTNPDEGVSCDQIYLLDLSIDSPKFSDLKLISTGLGRTTCSFFMPDGKHILYASTHENSPDCPKPPVSDNGTYLWPIYPEFDIYLSDLDGQIVKKLTDSPGYDAEAVLSPDGKKIAFTSMRSGDLEIYTMNIDGTGVKQITHELGYDGGAFFSHDSKKLVFRSSRPKTSDEINEYKDYLSKGLVAPTAMEIYTCNVDGTNLKQLTKLGKANWSPFFLPDDSGVIFSSNHHSKRGYDFQLFVVDTTGRNLKQITNNSNFNAFPMFSPDGKKIVFSSNRVTDKPHETNVYIADWVGFDREEIVSDELLRKHLKFLTSDELEGRLTGSKGEALAANYIEKELTSFGLRPFNNNSFFQNFEYNILLKNENGGSEVKPWKGKNIIAFLDNNTEKTIILGSHYDHLGKNEHQHSPKINPSKDEIYPGADDNASGTAALLELARILSQNKSTEKVNYLFAFFSGEEDGLAGSKYFAESLKGGPLKINAMINMDMIGRLDEDKNLIVGGVGTSPAFGELIEKLKPAGFKITVDSSGFGPSDHSSFYLQDIPVLFFFTGPHKDYHSLGDTEDKINYYGLRAITDFVFRVAKQLSEEEEIKFKETPMKTNNSHTQFKYTLGVTPSFAYTGGKGMLIEMVSVGKPGFKAGVKDGDIITGIGNCIVADLSDYTACLSEIKSGGQYDLFILRNGNEIKLEVEF